MKKYQYTVYDIFQVVMQTFIRHDNKYEKVEAQIKYMHTQSHKYSFRRIVKPNLSKWN
jgi:hypothetical protein